MSKRPINSDNIVWLLAIAGLTLALITFTAADNGHTRCVKAMIAVSEKSDEIAKVCGEYRPVIGGQDRGK